MALERMQIEHMERVFKSKSKSRKWLKNQMNRWIRRNYSFVINKFKRPTKGWEY